MQLTTKQKIIISVLALAVSFGCGWWATPTKVVTKVVTQTVVKEVTKQDDHKNTNEQKHQVTTTTETIKPDGTKIITTTTSDQDNTQTQESDKTQTNLSETKTTDSEKTIERDRGAVTLSALAGLKLNDISGGPVYGGHVEKRILGPIVVGVFGLSNSTGGISVGLTF